MENTRLTLSTEHILTLGTTLQRMTTIKSEKNNQLKVTQKRGQKTYDALIKTGFRLLEEKNFNNISIAELSKKAGYSVGAFYTRFRSKDEFFDALMAKHLNDGKKNQDILYTNTSFEQLPDQLIKKMLNYYWNHRKFWQAALTYATINPDFWTPVKKSGYKTSKRFIGRINQEISRSLTEEEESNVFFALQMVFGVINNTILLQPGPIFMGQQLFTENLTRSFRLISNIDAYIALSKSKNADRSY